jgi:hypothetical protein
MTSRISSDSPQPEFDPRDLGITRNDETSEADDTESILRSTASSEQQEESVHLSERMSDWTEEIDPDTARRIANQLALFEEGDAGQEDLLRIEEERQTETIEPTATVNIGATQKAKEARSVWDKVKRSAIEILKEVHRLAIPVLAYLGGFLLMATIIAGWPVSMPVMAVAVISLSLGIIYAQNKVYQRAFAEVEESRLKAFAPKYEAAIQEANFEGFHKKLEKEFDLDNAKDSEQRILLHTEYLKGSILERMQGTDVRGRLLSMHKKLQEVQKLRAEVPSGGDALTIEGENTQEAQKRARLEQLEQTLAHEYEAFKNDYHKDPDHRTFEDILDRDKLERDQYKDAWTVKGMIYLANVIAELGPIKKLTEAFRA